MPQQVFLFCINGVWSCVYAWITDIVFVFHDRLTITTVHQILQEKKNQNFVCFCCWLWSLWFLPIHEVYEEEGSKQRGL